MADAETVLELRPALWRFAQEMERTLRRHDLVKGHAGWKNVNNGMTMPYLASKNFAKLIVAVNEGNRALVLQKSADLANLCMMLYDLYVGLESES